MKNNRMLVTAVLLIVFGVTGIIAMALPGGLRIGTSPMGMTMSGGMMGGGMMDREGMKEMMQRMMPDMLPPGITPEDLPAPGSPGSKLLVRYCSQCHGVPSPAMHSAEEWPRIADRMFHRMSMMSGMMGMMMNVESPTSEERQMIVAYLKTHALKSIAPNALPAPETHGAVLFRNLCSQCHSLPDPKLHTADEWPGIVERMQSNMRSMRKNVLTENEKKEIVIYLMRYARS